MPLQLTRRVGESIEIGEGITVTLMDIFNDPGRRPTARLSVTAPPEVPVHRSEVARRIEAGVPPKPKPQTGDGDWQGAPVYLLTSRVHELHDWLRDTVRIDAHALVANRMVVVVTSPLHLRALMAPRFYAMPGTDPVVIAAAKLRPGAQRLDDGDMLEQIHQWRAFCRRDDLIPTPKGA